MRMTRLAWCLLCCSLASTAAIAQQQVPLAEETVQRLGLVYSKVQGISNASGVRFSMQVAASPHASTQVYALHGGIVQQRLVEPGETVAAGTPLLIVRSQGLLEHLQQWGEAYSRQQQMQAALKRDEALLADGIIAAQRVEQTRREADDARYQWQAATTVLTHAGFAAAELPALFNSAGITGDYVVRAPAAGTLVSSLPAVGQNLEEGARAAQLRGDSLWAQAALPVRVAGQLQVGQTLHTTDGLVALEIRQLESTVDSESQTVRVWAELRDATPVIVGQMLNVQAVPQGTGVVVPADAVVRNGDQTVVYVRNGSGVEARALQLRPLGSDYLAQQGLQVGDEVVVRGASLVKGITLGLGGE